MKRYETVEACYVSWNRYQRNTAPQKRTKANMGWPTNSSSLPKAAPAQIRMTETTKRSSTRTLTGDGYRLFIAHLPVPQDLF